MGNASNAGAVLVRRISAGRGIYSTRSGEQVDVIGTAVVVGYGSIGRVHAKNAKSLGWNVVTIDSDPKAEANLIKIEHAAGSEATHAVISKPVDTHIDVLCKTLQAMPSIKTVLV